MLFRSVEVHGETFLEAFLGGFTVNGIAPHGGGGHEVEAEAIRREGTATAASGAKEGGLEGGAESFDELSAAEVIEVGDAETAILRDGV